MLQRGFALQQRTGRFAQGEREQSCWRTDAGELHLVEVIQREVLRLARQRCCVCGKGSGAHALVHSNAKALKKQPILRELIVRVRSFSDV